MELLLRLPSGPAVLSRAERVVVPSWAYRFLSQAQDYRESLACASICECEHKHRQGDVD
jgi:hypothetical protein